MNYAKYVDLKSNDFRIGLIIELRIKNSSLIGPIEYIFDILLKLNISF